MGAILESPAAEWAVEVRRESWYLNVSGFLEYKYEGGEVPAGGLMASHAPAFSIPVDQLDRVIRVVRLVMEHQGLARIGENDPAVWTIVFGAIDDREVVMFEGPVITFGVGEQPELSQTVEFEYAVTPALLAALEDAKETEL